MATAARTSSFLIIYRYYDYDSDLGPSLKVNELVNLKYKADEHLETILTRWLTLIQELDEKCPDQGTLRDLLYWKLVRASKVMENDIGC